MEQSPQQPPSYPVVVEDLIHKCAQTYTSIINSQIIQILGLEAQIKNQKTLIASLSTKEHELQKELSKLRGNDLHLSFK